MRCARCYIIPPHILKHIALSDRARPDQRDRALEDLYLSCGARTERRILGAIVVPATVPAGEKRRTIYDAENEQTVRGTLVRGEKDAAVADGTVNRAYDYSGLTYDFFDEMYERRSIDGHGMRLDSTVHYGVDYANAFWNGVQMVYGDGDGELFGDFTECLDIVAHEMAHGVTQHEANLDYQNQPGALNESFSDVFGVLVKQWQANTTAAKSNWLIGDDLFLPPPRGSKARRDAIRSMEEPGSAYDDPLIGRDPQPGHMSGYVRTTDDDGGVHINSGIPNRAFYLAAKSIGGRAWEVAGHVWYVTLRDRLRSNATFSVCAAQTVAAARELHNDKIADKVSDAWKAVGVLK
jgi:Zn-dependent metalloprotease